MGVESAHVFTGLQEINDCCIAMAHSESSRRTQFQLLIASTMWMTLVGLEHGQTYTAGIEALLQDLGQALLVLELQPTNRMH